MAIMMKKISVFVVLNGLFFAGFSQTKMTLQNCIDTALANNIRMKKLNLNDKIQRTNLSIRKNDRLPNLNGNFRPGNSMGRSIDPNTNEFTTTSFNSYSGSLNANLALFSGFQKTNAIKQAQRDIAINQTEIKRLKNELIIDVSFRYINVLFLGEMVGANAEQIEFTNQQLNFANIRFEKGLITQDEVLKLKAQLSNENLTLINNQNKLLLAKIELKQLLQIPVSREIELENYTLNLQNINLPDYNQYAVALLKTQPQYQKQLIELEKAKTQIELSKAPLFPSLNLGSNINSRYVDRFKTSVSDQLNQNLSLGFNLNLSIPIFSKFKNKGNIKVSKLRYEQSKLDLKSSENAITKTLIKAILDAKASKQKYLNAKESKSFNSKSYQIDKAKFEAGQIDVTTFNLTKNQFIRAKTNLIQAKYEWMYNFAVIDFYRGNPFKF